MEPERKKVRRPNWDDRELSILVDGVEKYNVKLFGKFSASLTNSQKNNLWDAIATSVNSVGGLSRTVDECVNKCVHIKSDAKSNEKRRIKYRNRTGGGPPPKDASELEKRILSLIPKESISGISGGMEVSGPNYVTITTTEVHDVPDSPEPNAEETEITEESKPVSKKPVKQQSIHNSDPYLLLLEKQIEVDKARNEILERDRVERREFENTMIKLQKAILKEIQNKNSDELFHSLLHEN